MRRFLTSVLNTLGEGVGVWGRDGHFVTEDRQNFMEFSCIIKKLFLTLT